MRHIKILGTGVASPQKRVESIEIDRYHGVPAGRTEAICGVKNRAYATDESASSLAIEAIKNAISCANISIDDIDCIICASGTMEQAIPYNAAKVHALLKLNKPIPSFDINMTCLSALMAMDVASSFIEIGRYKNILICSSDLASVGLDWNNIEVGGLFGDGAAAMILCNTQENIGIKAINFETYSEGVDYCQIKGGGSLHHPSKIHGDYRSYGQFNMKGKDLYRLTLKVIGKFCKDLLKIADYTLDDIDWIVPHQASKLAIEHLQKKLSLNPDKVINILSTHGNQIAASLPTALHYLLTSDRCKRGDKILLIGTSAGLSLGGMILEI
ncbi:3-oxoacyl-[acyl-carrier-protein] synthase III C-terminal domain-containing protein [Agarilytica rhodophyticola]|uniref:3-oxoacyl-[acyl-carrier-protein] synthase III C-terminal domain-containing protein n=1 Tax=Agarilytica rhodophyticola TaxID=1737490 RepID=UPI000B344803|nr:3-oxoacyl-[acyl-carrier-protein] synthase III C-terminal domain-containing protein [Agarilytica rhodophyticola]